MVVLCIPMQSRNAPWRTQRKGSGLAGLAAAGADAATMAAEATAVWRAIEAALTPIVGTRGFAALLSRCVHDARLQFQWLSWPRDTDSGDGLAQLHSTLALRGPVDTLAVITALLQCFCGLLTSLIGAALTERLLLTVEPAPACGHAAEDDPQ
jgi:hypothetical protein